MTTPAPNSPDRPERDDDERDDDSSTPGVADIDDNSMPQDLRDEARGEPDDEGADVPSM